MVCLTGTNPRAKVGSPSARFVKSNLTKVESMKLLLSRMFFGIGCAVCLMVGMSCRPSPSAAAGAVQPRCSLSRNRRRSQRLRLPMPLKWRRSRRRAAGIFTRAINT